MKLIFIAGMAHSGSSLLDMLLSGHPGIVGLGETDFLIDDKKRNRHIPYAENIRCSCGKGLPDCPVWGEHLKLIGKEPGADFQACYSNILGKVKEENASTIAIVDSSKYPKPLEKITGALDFLGIQKEDFYVLHLAKDVRNHAASSKKRKPESGGALTHFGKWIRANKRLEDRMRSRDLQYLNIGYEELCFYPEYILKLICDFVRIDFDPSMADLANSGGHLGVGNPMSTDKTKSKKIFYDHRWLLDDRISFWYAVYPRLSALNKKWVYRNISKEEKRTGLYKPPCPT